VATERDYYEVLGLPRGATREEVRAAFRKLAMQHHPDRNPGNKEAEARFKEAAEAYEVLGDDDKRAAYDRFGKAGLGGRAHQFTSFDEIFSTFGDIFGGGGFFDGLFSTGGRSGGGVSLRCEIAVSFEEAARGSTKTIRLRRAKSCAACRGTGAKDGTALAPCASCGGTGRSVRSAGFFTMQTICGRCGGAGTVVREKCPTCEGEGARQESDEIEIRVPPGIEDGTRIRLAGEGEVDSPGGVPGDLYCHVHVEPHRFFTREGDDLACEVPITYSQATLGAEVEVPTLDGTVKVEISAGTQSGDVFRLRRKGIPNMRTGRPGDMLVRAVVEVPKKLTARQKEILRELAEIDQAAVSPKRKGFMEWLKEQFKGSNGKTG